MAPNPKGGPRHESGLPGQRHDQSAHLPQTPVAARSWPLRARRRVVWVGCLAGSLVGSLVGSITWAQAEHAPDAEPAMVPTAEAPTPSAAPEANPVPAETSPKHPVEPIEEVKTELLLNDGRRIEGVLVEQTETTVTIRVAGIAAPFPRTQINRLRTLQTVPEKYKSLRSRVKDLDFVERLKIADWLRSEEAFELALAEINGVIALDQFNIEARDLKLQVLLEQDLASKRVPPGEAPKPREIKPVEQDAAFPLLNDEQMNLIRVFEVDLKTSPRLQISKETIDSFLDDYRGRDGIPTTREGRDAFHRKPPVEILAAMFRVAAREYYPKVTVQDNPPSVRAFRDDVHNSWFLNSCATTACHGGNDAGRFYVANKGVPPDRMVLTNFLIIDRFKLADGRPLINYDRPAESPLLQLALPKSMGAVQHPDVMVGRNKVRWRSVFADQNDPRFLKAVQWIESMYKPRPDYPIDYQAPKAGGLDPGNR